MENDKPITRHEVRRSLVDFPPKVLDVWDSFTIAEQQDMAENDFVRIEEVIFPKIEFLVRHSSIEAVEKVFAYAH